MAERHHSKVLILGSGPAGYTAAIYAARANLKPHLVLGLEPGGQMTITTDVENYPGFAEVIQGPWLMEKMQKQAEMVGTAVFHDTIIEADLSRRPFTCTGDSGAVYTGDTLIICTGAQARWLGLESERKYRGFGVSACATCDGFFFRNKQVCVVGGGNTAVTEALFLASLAQKVTLVHRRDKLRAEKMLAGRLFANPKISVIWDSVLEEVLGEDDPLTVTGVKLKNVRTGEATTLELDGVFIAIGHDPATGLFKGRLEMDGEGYIITEPDATRTSVAGVYAAGDVRDKVYRQAVTAAGMGCMGALEAEKFLAEQESEAARSAAE